MPFRLLGIFAAAMAIGVPAAVSGAGLPEGFVYLADVDPSIVQDMRYFGSHNFVGRRVAGYDAAECILTDAAARALSKAQASLAASGFGLKVYDCYRPARAVRDFVAWSKKEGGDTGRDYFYPTIPKQRLFPLGYIASRSNHSAGSTVDIGLVRLSHRDGEATAPSTDVMSASNTSSRAVTCYARAPDASGVDLGTDFDCFHPKSAFAAEGLSEDARNNRTLLRRVMSDAGFDAYDTEWWHFTLRNEPFPKRAFDFPVTKRP
jgi:D-alanyl-D-alanine dipeptidase